MTTVSPILSSSVFVFHHTTGRHIASTANNVAKYTKNEINESYISVVSSSNE